MKQASTQRAWTDLLALHLRRARESARQACESYVLIPHRCPKPLIPIEGPRVRPLILIEGPRVRALILIEGPRVRPLILID